MNIAYLILAYNNPLQLFRLIRRLNSNNASFFIHIDKKVNISIFSNELSILNIKNINFIKRTSMVWGGFGIINATIEGIREILKNKNRFSYIVLLSGQDYPIKNNDFINEFFCKNLGKSFIEYFPLPYKGWVNGGIDRYKYYYINWKGEWLIFPSQEPQNSFKRKIIFSFFNKYLAKTRIFPNNMAPYGGSVWWMITSEVGKYILDFISNNQNYLNFFRYVFIPDEIFFQTIILNSKIKNILENIVCDNFRYIDWSEHYRRPKILSIDDADQILKSNKIFARKFDLNHDVRIFDFIDKNILKC